MIVIPHGNHVGLRFHLGNIGITHSVRAVSYTHLAYPEVEKLDNDALRAKTEELKKYIHESATAEPVSYTHLDVYKRQESGSAFVSGWGGPLLASSST